MNYYGYGPRVLPLSGLERNAARFYSAYTHHRSQLPYVVSCHFVDRRGSLLFCCSSQDDHMKQC